MLYVFTACRGARYQMLSPPQFHHVAETLGERFLNNPGDYVTEADLQVQLVHDLQDAIGHSPLDPRFDDNGGSVFKGAYEQAVYDGYQRNGLSPVHTEISMQKGERIDVGVLGTQNPTVSWENGSKKFDDGDVDALYELKFVKNRKKPPTTSGFKPYKERHRNYAKGTLQDAIDWGTVGVKPDVEALGRTSLKYRAVLVFSNFNYYYHRPTQEEVDHAPLYEDLGNAAWDVLETVGDDMAVNVMYVAPEFPGSGKGGGNCGGMTWIHEVIGLP